jgi:hypothetical protein
MVAIEEQAEAIALCVQHLCLRPTGHNILYLRSTLLLHYLTASLYVRRPRPKSKKTGFVGDERPLMPLRERFDFTRGYGLLVEVHNPLDFTRCASISRASCLETALMVVAAR